MRKESRNKTNISTLRNFHTLETFLDSGKQHRNALPTSKGKGQQVFVLFYLGASF